MMTNKTVWKKVPSVRRGGKPYFYVAFTPQGKRTVVWDRIEEKWTLMSDQEPPRGDVRTLGLFPTAKAAMATLKNPRKTMAAKRKNPVAGIAIGGNVLMLVVIGLGIWWFKKRQSANV